MSRKAESLLRSESLSCNPVTHLCCDPYCMATATQAATPPGVSGLRVLLCDKHAGRFVRLANERGIPLADLGLSMLGEP